MHKEYCFIYPEHSLVSDVTLLTYLLYELHERLRGVFDTLHSLYPAAFRHLSGLVLKFWSTDGAEKQLDPSSAADVRTLVHTLCTGFLQFQFRCLNISSEEYFKELALPSETQRALHEFGILDDEENASNYLCYIVDYATKPYTSVLKTQFGKLRYHLHLFFAALATLLKDPYALTMKDCFHNEFYIK